MNVRFGHRIPITYFDSKDVVDNQPSESRVLRSHIASQMSIPSDQMRFEEHRLKSFTSDWPHSFITPRVLAKTGFYYIGPQDQVRCCFCKVEVCRWESGDNEVIEHSRWSPNCPLLKRRETRNVPLEPVSELDELLPPLSYDVCGPSGLDIRPGSYAETQFTSPTRTETQHTSTISTERAEPMFTTEQIVHSEVGLKPITDFPEYAIETARLRSFREWPKMMRQRPEQLTDAGFFYTGRSDRVICFSCGGGLRDWDENDDPWEQHAIYYGKCSYVRLVKGQEYIDAVKAKDDLMKMRNSTEKLEPSLESVASTSLENDDQNQDNKLNESRLCKICYSREYNTAFLPCGHVIACTKCASSVTKCPLCRKPFERVMRVFFS